MGALAGKAQLSIKKGQLNAQSSRLPRPPSGVASSGASNPPAKQPNTYTTKSSATAKSSKTIVIPVVAIALLLFVAVGLIYAATR
jgi:hypothetical protein